MASGSNLFDFLRPPRPFALGPRPRGLLVDPREADLEAARFNVFFEVSA